MIRYTSKSAQLITNRKKVNPTALRAGDTSNLNPREPALKYRSYPEIRKTAKKRGRAPINEPAQAGEESSLGPEEGVLYNAYRDQKKQDTEKSAYERADDPENPEPPSVQLPSMLLPNILCFPAKALHERAELLGNSVYSPLQVWRSAFPFWPFLFGCLSFLFHCS